MPLIDEKFLLSYTDDNDVQSLNFMKIKACIAQGEARVIEICGHDFSNKKYVPMPFDVKLATAILAEFYALKIVQMKKSGITSETFDDYSYTRDNSMILEEPSVEALLKPYFNSNDSLKKAVSFSLRSL